MNTLDLTLFIEDIEDIEELEPTYIVVLTVLVVFRVLVSPPVGVVPALPLSSL